MPMIVEVNDAGEIIVPAELVQAAPHTRLEANRQGDVLILRPLTVRPARRDQSLIDPADTFRRAACSEGDTLTHRAAD
jgi:hypothetical protein